MRSRHAIGRALGLVAGLVALACTPRPPSPATTHAEAVALEAPPADDDDADDAVDPGDPAPASDPPPAGESSTVTTAPRSCPPPTAPPLPPPTGTIAIAKQPRSIRVHVGDAADTFADCVAHPWVVRTVAAKVDPVAAALRAVIEGPTPFEREQGLWSPFEHSTSDPAAPPLSPSQVKVTVKDGTATVDFAAAASPYLRQAVCAHTSVTTAIERTLLQFREIQRVQFAIDGTVIEEWDA